MSDLTSADVRTRILEPALDAIALNDRQRTLIAESRCAIDHGTRLARYLLARIDELLTLEHAEHIAQREIAGYADDAVRHLHASGLRESEGAGRELGDRLIVALDLLVGDDDYDRAEARVDLHDLFRRASADVIFRKSVTYTIGKRRTAQLADLHAAWTARRALNERAA
jgi:hypothetical protein